MSRLRSGRCGKTRKTKKTGNEGEVVCACIYVPRQRERESRIEMIATIALESMP